MNRKVFLSIEGIGKFEGVWTPENEPEPEPTPEPEKPIVTIPPSGNVIEFTDDYYRLIENQSEIELQSGKTYLVRTAKNIQLDKTLIWNCKGQATIQVGKENNTPWNSDEAGSLFGMNQDFVFASRNINWCMFPQLKKSERYCLNLLGSKREINTGWTALIQNCDTTVLGKNGGMGIGTLHGGIDENHVALIDYIHAGPHLMDLKNTDPDCVLYLTAENVITDYLDENQYNPTYFKGKVRFTKDFSGFDLDGYYGDHIAEVEEPLNFHLPASQFYYRGWNNRMNLIHIDRFTFWLPSAQFLQRMVDPIYSNKTKWNISDRNTQTIAGQKVIVNQIPKVGQPVRLCRNYGLNGNVKSKGLDIVIRSFINLALDGNTHFPVELQPNDRIEIEGIEYTIVYKERGNNWNIENEFRQITGFEAQYIYSNLTLDKPLPQSVPETFDAKVTYSSAEYLLSGDWFDAYIAYKGNSQIDLKSTDLFGDSQVLYSKGFGHLSYKHKEISLWAKNFQHNGFYRQSNGKGKTLGYNMVNCSGFGNEFNPPVSVTTDKPMPKRITDLLDTLK